MNHAEFQETIPSILRELSSTMMGVRDSLVELSLLLQDLQFEMNQEERTKAEAEFFALVEKANSYQLSDKSAGPRLESGKS